MENSAKYVCYTMKDLSIRKLRCNHMARNKYRHEYIDLRLLKSRHELEITVRLIYQGTIK